MDQFTCINCEKEISVFDIKCPYCGFDLSTGKAMERVNEWKTIHNEHPRKEKKDELPKDHTGKPIEPLIKWDSFYELGIFPIDEQHKSIVDLLNRIHAMIKQKTRSPQYAKHIILELDDYVKNHFAYEVKLFKAAKYPDLKKHVLEHRVFQNKIKELKEDYYEGRFSLPDLVNFLMKWLMDHIASSDKEFIYYWKEVQNQKANKEK